MTHPEKLQTQRDPATWSDSEPAVFRVYGYNTDPDVGPTVLGDPVLVQIPGLDLTQNVNDPDEDRYMQIRSLRGGVNEDDGTTTGVGRNYVPFANAVEQSLASRPYEMSYEVGYVSSPEPYTWIKLYNTPLVTPVVSNKGLDPAERLYGLEYIPSPVQVGTQFTQELDTPGGAGIPKNTARWEIQLPPVVFDSAFSGGFGGNVDRVVTVTTRIGDDTTTGVTWPVANQPHNVSRTYTWWASSAEAVPVTERYQFQGDPRLNPYLDSVSNTGILSHGYNWHFDDLRESLFDATPKWPCLDSNRLQDGFGSGSVADAPRLLQLLRTSLQSCGAVFVNPCGVAAQSLLLGGEIALPGDDPTAAPAPVFLHGDYVGATAPVSVDTVSPPLPSSTLVSGRQVVIGTGIEPFWAMPWLGELFPENHYVGYLATGNLPTGSLPGTFHCEPRSEAVLWQLPAGTDFGFPSGSSLGLAGSVAMMDSGSLASTLVHREETTAPVGQITEYAQSIADATGDDLLEDLPSSWPFSVDSPFPGTLPYFGYTSQYPKSALSILEQHYSGPAPDTAAGVLALEPASSLSSAFFSLIASSPSDAEHHGAVAMGSLMLGLRAFHRAGEPGVAGRITQVPLVEILEPLEGSTLTQPTSILMRWKTPFTRFDGESYTSAYPAEFSEPESDLVYSILYSRDDGETWRYALDSQPAEPGVRPTLTSLILQDGGLGPESLVLSTPSSTYTGGEYIFRVECYHATRKTPPGGAHDQGAAHEVAMVEQTKKESTAGFTIIEVAIVTAVIGVLTLLITQALADLSQSQAFTRGQARVAELADRVVRGIARDLSFSVRTFTDGQEADDYLAALAYPAGVVMPDSRLPKLIDRGYFDVDPDGELETGNMIFIGRYDEGAVVDLDGELITQPHSQPIRIDTSRFVLYYLRTAQSNDLDIARWASVPVASYKDILVIDAGPDRTTALIQLYAGGVRYAWDSAEDAANGLWQITPSGLLAALPTGVRVPGDPTEASDSIVGLRNARVSRNVATGKAPVPKYAEAGPTGFPGGLEVKVDGPSSGKLVQMRFVLRMGSRGSRENFAEVLRMISTRDG